MEFLWNTYVKNVFVTFIKHQVEFFPLTLMSLTARTFATIARCSSVVVVVLWYVAITTLLTM